MVYAFIVRCFTLLHNKLLSKVSGKQSYQSLFEHLHRKALVGMNYGLGGNISESGEIEVLKYVAKKINHREIKVFDVGANIGEYTKEVLMIFQNVQCYSFEPEKKYFEQLSMNLSGHSNVKLFNFGFGE